MLIPEFAIPMSRLACCAATANGNPSVHRRQASNVLIDPARLE
jgi:hypothetical protein